MAYEQTVENGARGTPGLHNRDVLVVIQQAELQLHQLIEERAKVAKRIGRLKQTISGLAEIFGDGILSAALSDLVDRNSRSRQSGITPACRRILMESGRPVSARDICDGLQRTVPSLLAHHKDPLATVHTILGRLVSYGEATRLTGDHGERTWLWAAESGKSSPAQDRGNRWQHVPGSVITSGI